MTMTHGEKIEALRGQGVEVRAPESVWIADDVDLARIRGPGTVLHPGTRLSGPRTLVLPGAQLGSESPAVVKNCGIGREANLAGGYHADAVYLDRAGMGTEAHVRAGTLLEEQASGAHTVGLKQTILLPYVTLGSLINFCDILMAGGTNRRDHSEVGSSFIHFNFTPFGESGDKATASLIGDVPRGVMLRSARIFLGGQAGLVGPLEIDYGTVLAAGFVYRRNHGPDALVVGEKLPPRTIPFNPHRYANIRQKVERNLRYIGNLVALWHWYEQVRGRWAEGQPDTGQLYALARAQIEAGIAERIKRLGQIAGYMERSVVELEKAGFVRQEIEQQQHFAEVWSGVSEQLAGDYRGLEGVGAPARQTLLQGLDRAREAGPADYLAWIKGLEDGAAAAGTAWLAALVDHVVGLVRWE